MMAEFLVVTPVLFASGFFLEMMMCPAVLFHGIACCVTHFFACLAAGRSRPLLNKYKTDV
jgi:hypothetical protein